MRHCLTCDASYPTDPPRCPTCGNRTLDDHELLVARERETTRTEEALVSVRDLEGPADEAFARSILDEAGFDFQIVTHSDDAFGTLVARSRGYGSVLVPADDADAARALLLEAFAAEPIPD